MCELPKSETRLSRTRLLLAVCCLLLSVAAGACGGRGTEAAAKSRPQPRPANRLSDGDRDGIPDGEELQSYNDRENFRLWFTAVAEKQFYTVSDEWNPAQRDCAGLVRFAWRESLRSHDRLWFQKMGPDYQPIAPDVSAVNLENGVLGEKLFRNRTGEFSPDDLTDNSFVEFADANTLRRFNSTFISRDRRQAKPGDLLFFYQPWVQKFPYHVMIFLGRAHDAPNSANDWVVYHTGSSPTDEGVVKKVRLSVLDHHPDPRWRPTETNRNFVGFYRLNILD
jgi:uncharacterized protein YfaT (DUF1175 family)